MISFKSIEIISKIVNSCVQKKTASLFFGHGENCMYMTLLILKVNVTVQCRMVFPFTYTTCCRRLFPK